MKTLTFANLFSFILIVLLAASCGSNKNFSSRKYTSGNYVSHKHKTGKVTVNEPIKEPAYAAKENGLTKEDLAVKSPLTDEEATLYTDIKKPLGEPLSKATQSTFLKNTKKTIKSFKEKHSLIHIYSKVKKQTTPKPSGESGSIDASALISLILSVLAVVANIAGVLMVISTSNYVFMLLFLVGLILGIVGLVFGTIGLRHHRKSGGSTLELVFSIVGTALGGVAIITALFFTVYSILFIAIGA